MSYGAFMDLLKARGATVTSVLRAAGVGRSHGCLVLAGKRGGRETREVIKRELTVDEIRELGWHCPRGLTRVEAGGKYDFVASLEYKPGPGSDALVCAFLAAMTELHDLNETDGAITERRDV